MPFIWDNFEWMLVNDEDPYDKNRFVVARKLLVKPVQPDTVDEVFYVGSIRRHFQKFGEIESIDMLLNSENEQEAHVTFVSDRIACFVQSHYELGKKMEKVQPYEIEPADTWEQPLQKINSPPEHSMEFDDEQSPEIFMLTEDCLLHLFRFLDFPSLVNMADVCKMFNRLLHRYSFPHYRNYEISCNRKNTLAQTRRELLCIGRHITDLYFAADYVENEEGEWVETDMSSKFLRVLAQNVGQNIRRANLILQVYTTSRIMMLAPILRNLETLEIGDMMIGSNCINDLPAFCPNLINLRVRMDTPMVASCRPCPSLLTLSVMENRILQPETLISIIEQNPQITCLEFSSVTSNQIALFTAITTHLSGLEKMTIHTGRRDVFGIQNSHFNFNRLGELPHLVEITFYYLKIENLESVIDHLPNFKSLRKIELCAQFTHLRIINYEQSLVNLVKQLPLLEELQLVNIPIEEESFFTMICYGRKLKTFRIYGCELFLSYELIIKLVDILKSYRRESDKPLQLFGLGNDLDKLGAAKSKEIQRYIQLNCY